MTEITEVRLVLDVDQNGSRVGYASVVVQTDDGFMLRLDQMVIYRAEGRLGIAYPKRDKKKDIAYYNPLNRQTGALIESAIFGELLAIKNMTVE